MSLHLAITLGVVLMFAWVLGAVRSIFGVTTLLGGLVLPATSVAGNSA